MSTVLDLLSDRARRSLEREASERGLAVETLAARWLEARLDTGDGGGDDGIPSDLEEHRNLLRRSQRVARIGGWEYDPDTDTARGTEELYRILGLPVGEGFSLGTGLDFYAPEAQPLVAEAIQRCLTEGVSFDHEVPIVRTDGERRWVRVRGQATRVDGEVRRLTGTLQDVTERREAEQKLVVSRSKVRRLIEHSSQIVFMVDAEGILLVSEGDDLQAIGIEPGEHVGRSVYELYADYPEMLEAIDRALAGESVDAVLEIEGATFDAWYAPYYDENDEVAGCLGMAADVTERERHQRELRENKQEAEEASDMKSALLENMSHEIRTPLSAVIGFAELIEGRTEGQIEEWAVTIKRSGKRLHDTLDKVLSLAQLEGGEYAIDLETVDVGARVEEAVRLMEPKAQRSGLRLSGRVEGLEKPVRLSPSVLESVLGRLIHNAVKFTEEGRVDLEADRRGSELRIRVRDTGIGIPEEVQRRVREPFFQASRGWSREYEGTGLGLTLVTRLVDQAGGTVQIDSRRGEGTTVTVLLPIEEVESEATGSTTTVPSSRAGNSAVGASSLRCLVVEDDEGMRALVREMLPKDVHVDEAADPYTTLRRVRERSYDIVLLDVNLRSERTGVELLEPIRAARSGEDPPYVVAMTAYAAPRDREQFLAGGFDDYLAKPFTRSELFDVLHRPA